MDLSRLKVVDGFGHLFDPVRSGERGGLVADAGRDFYSFAREWSVATFHPTRDRMEETVLLRRVVRELAALLGCEPDPETLRSVRDQRYLADPRRYIQELWSSAGIEMMLFDTGSPTVGEVSLDLMRRNLPCEFRTIHRIEAAIHELLATTPPFHDGLRAFTDSIDRAVLEDRVVGLKSVGSYFTGLDVEVFDESVAKRAYEALRASTDPRIKPLGPPPGPDEPIFTESAVRHLVSHDGKIVRDFFFTVAMRKALEHDIPFLIHTGLGGGPYYDMNRAHPLLLHDVLADDDLRPVKVVIVYGGYPWPEESGYLANHFDNVYVDIGEMFPMAGPGMTRRFSTLLEMAPTNKIMYGSDGFGIPEIFWFAAVQGKRAIGSALDELISDEWLTEREAWRIAESIFSANARRLYRLDN